MNQSFTLYNFHKTKYGKELLIDVVTLEGIKKYIKKTPIHTLSYYDITFITKGEGVFINNGTPFQIKESDVIFSKPKDIREWIENETIEGYALLFEEEFLISFFNDSHFIQNLSYFSTLGNESRITLGEIEYANILDLILSIKDEINMQPDNDIHILRAQLYQALTLLNREYISNTSSVKISNVNHHVNKYLELVEKGYKENHSIKYYANQLCLTPNYLNEIIKKHTGHTAKQVIQNKILSEIKTLLRYSHLSITEIAESMNYENTSYLIRFFRKNTGLTPIQYRKKGKP